MKLMVAFVMFLIMFIAVGHIVAPAQSISAVDPKATPTPNWCCDFNPSRYCQLCPPKVIVVEAQK